MKAFLKIKIFLFILIGSIFHFATAQNAANQLINQLNTLNSMQANFAQTSYDAHNRVLKNATGTMALKKPGKFRWQTQSPNQQLIIADGQNIWIYDADLQQATKQSQNKPNAPTFNPAYLLSGAVGSLPQKFNITLASSNGNQVYTLTPKDSNAMFKSIQLTFKNNTLMQMTVVDNLSQLTNFGFNNVNLNNSLDDSLFRFEPPKGTDIINQ